MITALDKAVAVLQDTGETDAGLRDFYRFVAGQEIFIWLEEDASAATARPVLVDIEGAPFALGFDTDARLAEFAGQTAPYLAVSGRGLVDLLGAHALGLAVNADVSDHPYIIPAAAFDWMGDHLGQTGALHETGFDAVYVPKSVPEPVLTAIDNRLSAAQGMAQSALLVRAAFTGGGAGLVLAIIDAAPGARAPLRRALAEVTSFAENGSVEPLHLVFVEQDHPLTSRLAAVGLRFDLPQITAAAAAPAAPGRNPDKPPILR